MTKEQLDELSMAIEKYGNGFILADYSGNRGEAAYCGQECKWRGIPVNLGPEFPTEEAAVQAGSKEVITTTEDIRRDLEG